jgi:hypothetical protein
MRIQIGSGEKTNADLDHGNTLMSQRTNFSMEYILKVGKSSKHMLTKVQRSV